MKVEEDYGYIKIKLEDLIKENEISKNKLAHRAELQRTQLNQYCNGTVTRLDTAVLARICNALDCKSRRFIRVCSTKKIRYQVNVLTNI